MTPKVLNEMSGGLGEGNCVSQRDIQSPGSRYGDVPDVPGKTPGNIVDTSAIVPWNLIQHLR